MENKATKTTPRDVFMHIFLVGLLYFAAFQFLQLVFGLIDAKFPDALDQNQYHDPGSSLRWAIATLIVLFPTFLWVSKFLRRDITKNPEKRELRTRKWLLYLTLFLTAILIIGDLVTLVLKFLNGEITTHFVLKVIAILIVAAGIFRYYLSELRDGGKQTYVPWFAWGSTIVVLAAIVGGFFIAGSPFTQRLVRFDAQRVSDLQSIQYQIVNYWQKKNKLPAVLTDLNDPISNVQVPVDPETHVAYRYRVTGNLEFELCADFNLHSQVQDKRGYSAGYATEPYGPTPLGSETWDHVAGEQCFLRTIDPELYPPIPKGRAIP